MEEILQKKKTWKGALTRNSPFSDINERELRLITAMTEDLHLILLECPNISTPADVAQLNMAPIMFLFRISNRKVLIFRRQLIRCVTTQFENIVNINIYM